MGPSVKRQRQIQHVPKVAAHRFDAVPMCQTLGLQCDTDVTDDAADADGDPDAQQHCGLMPHLGVWNFVGLRQQVHDPAEQDRIEKLQARDHEIGESQEPGDPDISAKKAEHAAIGL